MKELNTIYKFLTENQLTTSQEHFSKYWLHKSDRYYATIKSSNRDASVEALSTLMVKLYGLGDELRESQSTDAALLWYTATQFADKLRQSIAQTSLHRQPHKRDVGLDSAQIKTGRNFGQRLLQMTFG